MLSIQLNAPHLHSLLFGNHRTTNLKQGFFASNRKRTLGSRRHGSFVSAAIMATLSLVFVGVLKSLLINLVFIFGWHDLLIFKFFDQILHFFEICV